jgi:hypothetical protein
MAASAGNSAEEALGHYVYGVVAAGSHPPPDVSGVDPGHLARRLEEGGLAALVGAVPLAEFGEGRLEESLSRPEWLEAKVRAHEAVLEGAQAAGDVVPFRFGTVYLSEAHVRGMLVRERAVLEAALARVRGKREWGVKGLVDRERLTDWLARRRSDLADAGGPGGEGTAYLARKQASRRVEDEVEQATVALARDCHTHLAAYAADAVVNPLPRAGEDAGAHFLNAAYLIAGSRDGELRAALRELSARYGDQGVSLRLTGPWPPYNFVATEAIP